MEEREVMEKLMFRLWLGEQVLKATVVLGALIFAFFYL